ncbi:DNA-directed RNA polymerase II subunit 2 [Citrus sinensis]|nr:DNA-directed RNA polymerase II subunit 2 [Citrus sinensis]
MLPNVAMTEFSRTKKAYYFGCIINRLLLCALGRWVKDVRYHYVFRKLNWNVSLCEEAKTITHGINCSLMLNYVTCASTLSHLRTRCTQVKPRLAHNTMRQDLFLCNTFGISNLFWLIQACGLVKNLALRVNVTLGSLVFPINELLEYEPIDFISSAIEVSRDIRSKELHIYTNFGRCFRQLLIVQNQRLLKKKKDIDTLYDKGFIEYIDPQEEETIMICMTINVNKMVLVEVVNARLHPNKATSNAYTHYKIHSSLILGAYASIIPFPNHNQVPPCNVFQAAMSKQTIGIYDALAYVLYYLQKPLLARKDVKLLQFNQLPTSVNVIVTIACYNVCFIFFEIYFIKFLLFDKDEEKGMSTIREQQFGRPAPSNIRDIQHGNYDKLDADGLMPPVSEGDVIIGETAPITIDQQTSSYTRCDLRTSLPSGETGKDKFSSLHARKGTIGMYNQEDMPWPVEGDVPSLMTLGRLIECIFCVGDIIQALHKCGYQKYRPETMYNGHTGKRLHMVEDKIHSCARGMSDTLTRQPFQGQSHGAHGAICVPKERLFVQSDPYRVHVREHCGLMAIADLNNRKFLCKGCQERANIIHIPYACKLLFQELMAVCIAPRNAY